MNLRLISRLLLMITILSGSTLLAEGQPGPGRGGMGRAEKVEALYIAFMTRELRLTEEDAQKFWPVHAQYEAELLSIHSDMPELDRQQAVLNIKKKYQEKFIKVLGAERTDEFYRKDAEFKKRLLERLQEMKDGKGPGNRDMRMRRMPN